MNVYAGGIIHLRMGEFPLGILYSTADRVGVAQEGFDTPTSAARNLRIAGTPAPPEVHAQIMAVLAAPAGKVRRHPKELRDWYDGVLRRRS